MKDHIATDIDVEDGFNSHGEISSRGSTDTVSSQVSDSEPSEGALPDRPKGILPYNNAQESPEDEIEVQFASKLTVDHGNLTTTHCGVTGLPYLPQTTRSVSYIDIPQRYGHQRNGIDPSSVFRPMSYPQGAYSIVDWRTQPLVHPSLLADHDLQALAETPQWRSLSPDGTLPLIVPAVERDGFQGAVDEGSGRDITTEGVRVPTSDHIAEIVGRQGCKIKALRAKTNTYIKTPVRGEEPVFVVTGRKEDVAMAKREILSAAEHFSQIRASRKNNLNGSMAPGPPNIPGQVTIQVRVPYRVVGLVVGPKGATIKRIQQQTHTYIVTPSRDKDPVFEVTGLPDNVELAKKEIEAHIAMRTGGMFDSAIPGGPPNLPHDDEYNGLDGGQMEHRVPNGDLVSSLYKTSINGLNGINTLNELNSYSTFESNNLLSGSRTPTDGSIFSFAGTNGLSTKINELNGFPNGLGLYDTSNGGDAISDSFDPSGSSAIWGDLAKGLSLNGLTNGLSNGYSNGLTTRRSNSVGSSGTPTRLSPPLADNHTPARRINSDPLTLGLGLTTAAPTVTTASSSVVPICDRRKRDCIVCYDSEVVSALVPCGHNFFCMECANRLCEKQDGECPVCRQKVSQAIRILS